MEIVYGIYMVVGLLGLVLGSFAGATVWRLRAAQLTQDKKDGEPYDKAELKRLKPLTTSTVTNDRSRCLDCGHVLAWYDLLPLVSWLSTPGGCRCCKKKIGYFEPLMEIGTATAFVLFFAGFVATFGLSLPGILQFVPWFAALTMLAILFAYDLKWFLLPDKVMFPLIGLSAVIALINAYVMATEEQGVVMRLFSTLLAVVVLAGLYFVLWFMSKGRWVGFGDVKLGIALGLLLGGWDLALLTLFLANLIGTLIVIPGMLMGKLSRKTQVPFGPLLIVGFFISLLYGDMLITGYSDFSLWLSTTMLML